MAAPVLLAAPVLVVVTTALFGGIGAWIFAIVWMTTRHGNTARDFLARVMSLDALGMALTTPIGLLASGAFDWSFSTQTIAGVAVAAPLTTTLPPLMIRRVRSMSPGSFRRLPRI